MPKTEDSPSDASRRLAMASEAALLGTTILGQCPAERNAADRGDAAGSSHTWRATWMPRGELAARAVAVNPNLAFAWAASGWVNVWTGLAHAHFMAGEYEEATAVAVRALQVWRQAPPLRVAAASAALGGRREEAKAFMRGLLEIDPTRRLSNLADSLGAYRRREDIERLTEGLRFAGLPE